MTEQATAGTRSGPGPTPPRLHATALQVTTEAPGREAESQSQQHVQRTRSRPPGSRALGRGTLSLGGQSPQLQVAQSNLAGDGAEGTPKGR